MTVWATSNSVLTTPRNQQVRSKAFSIPVKLVSLLSNTVYTFYVNGINMNWACKPFGGTLGANLVSNSQGKLHFKFIFDQQHLTGYINNNANNNPVSTRLTCTVQGPAGNTATFYIPMHLKPSQ